jgi:hypothetical protein
MWTYIQTSGAMIRPDGSLLATGYAGHGEGRNNPAFQAVAGVGPLPCGMYSRGPLEEHHGSLGANVAQLEPDPANQMFGRSGFYSHGRHNLQDLDASHGCLVLDHDARMEFLTSPDTGLRVISHLDPEVVS